MQASQDYKSIRLLGQGSYAKAFLVERVSDGKQFVIKQIEIGHMTDDEKKEVQKEATVLQSLDHPYIIKSVEHYKTRKGRFCIVMEYAEGGDLGQVISKTKGHIQEEQILIWLYQISSALKYVHNKNIIHRDIKSQNLFLDSQQNAKLADFGIARVLSSTKEKAQTFIGTPYYLAPELVDSKPYTTKADIWSLGVLIYSLCALKTPFEAEGIPALMLKISRGQYSPLPSRISKELRILIGEMLTVDQNARISAQQILEKPLMKNRLANGKLEEIPQELISNASIENINANNRVGQHNNPNNVNNNNQKREHGEIRFYSPQHNMDQVSQQKQQRQQKHIRINSNLVSQEASPTEQFKQVDDDQFELGGLARVHNRKIMRMESPNDLGRNNQNVNLNNLNLKQNVNDNKQQQQPPPSLQQQQQQQQQLPNQVEQTPQRKQFRVHSPVPKMINQPPPQQLQSQDQKVIYPQNQQSQQQPLQNQEQILPSSRGGVIENLSWVPPSPNIGGSNQNRIGSPIPKFPQISNQTPISQQQKILKQQQNQSMGEGIGLLGPLQQSLQFQQQQSKQLYLNADKLKKQVQQPPPLINITTNSITKASDIPSPKLQANRPSSGLIGLCSNNNLLKRQQVMQQQQTESTPTNNVISKPAFFDQQFNNDIQVRKIPQTSHGVFQNQLLAQKINPPLQNFIDPSGLDSPNQLLSMQQQQKKFVIKKNLVNVSINQKPQLQSQYQQLYSQQQSETNEDSNMIASNDSSNTQDKFQFNESTQQVTNNYNPYQLEEVKTSKKVIPNAKPFVSLDSLDGETPPNNYNNTRGSQSSNGSGPLSSHHQSKQSQEERKRKESYNDDDLRQFDSVDSVKSAKSPLPQQQQQQSLSQQMYQFAQSGSTAAGTCSSDVNQKQGSFPNSTKSHHQINSLEDLAVQESVKKNTGAKGDNDKETKVERKIIYKLPFQEVNVKKKKRNTDQVSENEEEQAALPPKQQKTNNLNNKMQSSPNQQQQNRIQDNDQLPPLPPTHPSHDNQNKEENLESIINDYFTTGNYVSEIKMILVDNSSTIEFKPPQPQQLIQDAEDDIFNESQGYCSSSSNHSNEETNANNNNNNNNHNSNNNNLNSNNNINMNSKKQFQMQQQMPQLLNDNKKNDRIQNLRDQLEKEIGTNHFTKVYKLSEKSMKLDNRSQSSEFSNSLKDMFPTFTDEAISRYATLFNTLVMLDQKN